MPYIIQELNGRYVYDFKSEEGNLSATPPEIFGLEKSFLEVIFTNDLNKAFKFEDLNHAKWIKNHIQPSKNIIKEIS